MNRIVRERFPVADLPKTLREGLSLDDSVRVTLERDGKVMPEGIAPLDLDDLFARSSRTFQSADEVVDHVRAIRSEWD